MSQLFDGYSDHFNAEARLIILRALSEEKAGRLNSTMITKVLESFAINRSREYVHTQLRWLETEAQAVILTEAGSVLVAELTQQGEDHLERRAKIEGISSPSRRRA
ncbi:hypothetical protein SAMN04488527_101271 [Aliiroseovarius crassostreae]|uniref:ArsR family transcriptional regulator n=1 Tax=Aliiroseovarius crassostreae TaxID=154981 RepID=A0A0P7IZJ6_9RHOB|nr:hypothetical protein [Aliiroseovarius crassostreae]KPN64268.1 hypothetical protein AKJ29_16680 [Aliiroseovarius crassostreae]SFU31365.1 hypothetical protein SAMN04488527_101271 [Aliiroseovarius crassostreae]